VEERQQGLPSRALQCPGEAAGAALGAEPYSVQGGTPGGRQLGLPW